MGFAEEWGGAEFTINCWLFPRGIRPSVVRLSALARAPVNVARSVGGGKGVKRGTGLNIAKASKSRLEYSTLCMIC